GAEAIPRCYATPTRRGRPGFRSERKDPLDEGRAVLGGSLVGRMLLRVAQLGDEVLLGVGLALVLLGDRFERRADLLGVHRVAPGAAVLLGKILGGQSHAGGGEPEED